MKSGAVIMPDGSRGVFIEENELGKAGDLVQYMIRVSRNDDNVGPMLENPEYNMYNVLSLLLTAQKDNVLYNLVNRTDVVDTIEVFVDCGNHEYRKAVLVEQELIQFNNGSYGEYHGDEYLPDILLEGEKIVKAWVVR